MVNFDLVEWLANHDERKAAASDAVKADRDLAHVAVGITSQARIAAIKYFETVDALENARQLLHSSRALLHETKIRVEKEDLDELALEEIQADVLSEEVEWLRAQGEANAALAELQAAMGTNYQEPPPS